MNRNDWDKKFAKHILDTRRKLGFKRVGRCKHCGGCCKQGEMIFDIKTLRFKRYKENGCCEVYDLKKSRCKVWKNRPGICKMFPFIPISVPEGLKRKCGYRFIKL